MASREGVRHANNLLHNLHCVPGLARSDCARDVR
jgi:hypothetical protein